TIFPTSNIVILSLPNNGLSLSSARISRLFSGFCSLCALKYFQSPCTASARLTDWELPRISASLGEGFNFLVKAVLAIFVCSSRKRLLQVDTVCCRVRRSRCAGKRAGSRED